MKCNQCRSCARLIRIDYESESFYVWYCKLCGHAFHMGNKTTVEKDSDLYNKVCIKYKELYGERI